MRCQHAWWDPVDSIALPCRLSDAMRQAFALCPNIRHCGNFPQRTAANRTDAEQATRCITPECAFLGHVETKTERVRPSHASTQQRLKQRIARLRDVRFRPGTVDDPVNMKRLRRELPRAAARIRSPQCLPGRRRQCAQSECAVVRWLVRLRCGRRSTVRLDGDARPTTAANATETGAGPPLRQSARFPESPGARRQPPHAMNRRPRSLAELCAG